MAHLKITEGIYQVEGVNCNVYLVEDGDKLILIDTGLPRSDKKIVKYIEELGRKPHDVSTIVITHFHIDHVGSLKKMKDAHRRQSGSSRSRRRLCLQERSAA